MQTVGRQSKDLCKWKRRTHLTGAWVEEDSSSRSIGGDQGNIALRVREGGREVMRPLHTTRL